jgi:hypothetical protein
LTTTFDSIIKFTSKDCKSNRHKNCANSWNGFGFEVYCSCYCHHKKEDCSCYCHHKIGEALESVGGPVANTIHDVQPFSVGDIVDNG